MSISKAISGMCRALAVYIHTSHRYSHWSLHFVVIDAMRTVWHRVMADGAVAEDGSPRDLLSDDGSLFSRLCAELGKREQDQLQLALATQ